MRVFRLAALVLCLSVVSAYSRPPEVPRLSERVLDRASYVALAAQWKAYIEENGESAEALVNLGMAYDYSGEQEAATAAARRAVELGPDNPRALAFLGKMLAVYQGDEDESLKLLQHCREVAPEYEYGLIMLATSYLRRGEITQSGDVFKTIFDQRSISRPLQDYGYNTLVALPRGAVLITGGDNDTFPALALQAGMGLRPDVIILNRSLLNLPAYCEAQFDRHPDIRPDYNIAAHEVKMVDGKPRRLAEALIEKMIQEHKAAVFFTVAAAATDNHDQPAELRLEGVNCRASGKGLSAEESAQLFLGTYRLDSATDWTVPWSLAPTEAKLMANYVTAMVKLADTRGVRGETKTRLLDRAEAIAEFHHLDHLRTVIRGLRTK